MATKTFTVTQDDYNNCLHEAIKERKFFTKPSSLSMHTTDNLEVLCCGSYPDIKLLELTENVPVIEYSKGDDIYKMFLEHSGAVMKTEKNKIRNIDIKMVLYYLSHDVDKTGMFDGVLFSIGSGRRTPILYFRNKEVSEGKGPHYFIDVNNTYIDQFLNKVGYLACAVQQPNSDCGPILYSINNYVPGFWDRYGHYTTLAVYVPVFILLGVLTYKVAVM